MTEVTSALTAALSQRYLVERELGAGGMATVYLARDLKHDREVAIKVLHPDLASALGAERFLAEIKTTAKLQHPHILPLLDSGEAAGFLFYVMPVVDGETLRARLTRERQLPLDEALRIATETASALDYAHRHGVIHRDIKPENILVHDGRAVVADFGIALAVSAASGPRMTQTGLSLGTPQYMSPEQAMGERSIDGRADVYALGAVVYEMLTGEPPFTGATVQAIVAKVLTERPMNPTAVRDTVPRHVEAAVLKALAKLPADRFATPAQFADALTHPERMAATTSTATVAGSGAGSTRRMHRYVAATPLVWAALAVAAASAVVAASSLLRRTKALPATPVNIALGDVAGAAPTTSLFGNTVLALSDDGRLLAYAGIDTLRGPRVFVRSLTDPIAPAIVVSQFPSSNAAFSPDGQAIAVFTPVAQAIIVTRLATRATQRLAPASSVRGLAWTDDSTIVFAGQDGFRQWRIGARASEVFLNRTADSGYGSPARVSPELLLFEERPGDRSQDGELGLLDTRTKRATRLGVNGSRPGYVSPGIVTYLHDGALWGVPFDARKRAVTGTPRLIAEPSGDAAVTIYSAARNGSVVIARGVGMAAPLELDLVDRAGKARPLVKQHRPFRWPRFAPDGRRIAVTAAVVNAFVGDLWTVPVNGAETGTLVRVTTDSASIEPEWDPNGKELIFIRRTKDNPQTHVERVSADGSGAPTLLRTRPNPIFETALTPDRRTIVWREDSPDASRNILYAPVDSPDVAHPLRTSGFDERGFALSPDGHWLAYTSDESGIDEVYVCRVEPNGPRWPVSRNGGSEPRWARSGELFYRSGDSVLVTRVSFGAEPKIDPPRVLFGGSFVGAPFEPLWDVSPDGKQFVMVRQPEGPGIRLILMTNWVERWLASGKKQ